MMTTADYEAEIDRLNQEIGRLKGRPSHLTKAQAARRIGVADTTILRYITLGQLDAAEYDGTEMVPTDQVDELGAAMGRLGRRRNRRMPAEGDR